MIPAFSSVISSAANVFSRNFLYGGVLPATVLSGVSVALAAWCWPDAAGPLQESLGAEVGDLAPTWLGTLILLMVLAFVLSTLNPWMLRLLEGGALKGRLFRGLRREMEASEQHRHELLAQRVRACKSEVFRYRRAARKSPTWPEGLKEARIAGEAAPGAGYEVPAAIRDELEHLDALRRARRPIPFAELDAFRVAVEAELRSASAVEALQLDQLQTECSELFTYACEQLETDLRRLGTSQQVRFPRTTMGSTRIGNVGEIHREYGELRYGFDIELLWPRVIKFMLADEQFGGVLTGTESQLVFSVAMTFGFGLLTVFWVPATLFFTPLVLPYFAVILAGPVLTFVFYRIAVESRQVFAETARAGVDLFRFELLSQMHVALPGDSVRERALWERLFSDDPDPAIPYEHE